jgi:hypothetical protein
MIHLPRAVVHANATNGPGGDTALTCTKANILIGIVQR